MGDYDKLFNSLNNSGMVKFNPKTKVFNFKNYHDENIAEDIVQSNPEYLYIVHLIGIDNIAELEKYVDDSMVLKEESYVIFDDLNHVIDLAKFVNAFMYINASDKSKLPSNIIDLAVTGFINIITKKPIVRYSELMNNLYGLFDSIVDIYPLEAIVTEELTVDIAKSYLALSYHYFIDALIMYSLIPINKMAILRVDSINYIKNRNNGDKDSE